MRIVAVLDDAAVVATRIGADVKEGTEVTTTAPAVVVSKGAVPVDPLVVTKAVLEVVNGAPAVVVVVSGGVIVVVEKLWN